MFIRNKKITLKNRIKKQNGGKNHDLQQKISNRRS